MGSDGALWIFLRMLLALPVVLLGAYVAIRFMASRKIFAPGARRLRLVETLSLGGKGALVLVEMGGRYYFLACQEGAVALLKEMDELPPPLEMAAGGLCPGLGNAIPRINARWRSNDLNSLVKAWRGKHGPR